MERMSSGPPIVVGQLQLEFDDLEPLTLDQRLEQWLATQDQLDADVLTATLVISDNESRLRRVERWTELLIIQSHYPDQTWLVAGGIEAVWLYRESCRNYINGAFLSALLIAHTVCERVLAGCLFAYREELGSGWIMWGLGKLIKAAAERGIINDLLRDDLTNINETRKVSAHFKPEHETTVSVGHRALAELAQDPEMEYGEAVDSIVRSDALFALGVATYMVQSDLSITAF